MSKIEIKKTDCPAMRAYKMMRTFLETNTDEDKRRKCWEFMSCSDHSCPAIIQSAGRRCWLIAGTFSGRKAVCRHARQIDSCTTCPFYIYVKNNNP
ncbi:MAG: hypothetical protein HQK89_09545 [Nitrospirae bacterium]|nr:hypothetical protein [Nitrospirota bacterium]